MSRLIQFITLAALIFTFYVPSLNASPDIDVIQSQQLERRWKLKYFNYAKKCAMIGEEFAICEGYDPRFPSSRGVTVAQGISMETKPYRLNTGGLVKTYYTKPDPKDIEAFVKAIPDLTAGEFGYIHSARVGKVIDENTMIVNEVWLVDARTVEIEKAKVEKEIEHAKRRYQLQQREQERRNDRYNNDDRDRNRDRDRDRNSSNAPDFNAYKKRLELKYKGRDLLIKQQTSRSFVSVPLMIKGIPTRGAVAGKRWYGPDKGKGVQVAVVGKIALAGGGSSRSSRSSEAMIAVPARTFKRGMEDEQFRKLLETAGVTREGFLNRISEELKANKDKDLAEANVFAMLHEGLDAARKPADSEAVASSTSRTSSRPDRKTSDRPLTSWQRKALERKKREQGLTDGDADDGDKSKETTSPKKEGSSQGLTSWQRKALERKKAEEAAKKAEEKD